MNYSRSALALLLVAIGMSDVLDAREMPGIKPDEPVEGIHVETEEGFMVPYQETIPGTEVSFEMVPIPAGEFLLGSPASESDRDDVEGPQVRVQVPAFWIGKCEVTWAEYHAYMEMYEVFKSLSDLREDGQRLQSLESTRNYIEQESVEVDGVTAPTPLYDPSFTYYPGEDPDQPAVTMTQFAAKQYTKWLSGLLGRQYRLPSEAEWEYAARAGSSTAYCFGDDPQKLAEFAWFVDNSDDETHAVGKKKPNAWGLHDMHGNAAEWVLDEFLVDHYAKLEGKVISAADAIAWPGKLYPRVIRGGCWFDDASLCRSAARHKSNDPDWTLSDPNLPKSPWWYTEDPSTGVGFRVMRPLKPMDADLCRNVWDADIEWIEQDVADRLDEGRGAIGASNSRLPGAIAELREAEIIE